MATQVMKRTFIVVAFSIALFTVIHFTSPEEERDPAMYLATCVFMVFTYLIIVSYEQRLAENRCFKCAGRFDD